MRNVNNSVETVNAAASAIVSAESRVQPTTVQKRRWGSCWSLYWCFGSQKNTKRISHAALAPEPAAAGVSGGNSENTARSTAIVMPFIAPPSSPASFLQSDPPSATQSPAGLLSLTINTYSPRGPPSVFAVGPYAHETQPVTPPVFSAFTTEPSTAPFTPPPESVQITTPSSPEVPFAQLLTSSLERARRNGGTGQKFSYEFQAYHIYSGSPGGNLISPASVVSNSGTSSPYLDKNTAVEFRMGEPPKFLGFEHFTAHRWGSRFCSGSLTPAGQGSRLGSGSLTPDGMGLGSRLASGSLTPTDMGLGSRLGSGSLTPDGTCPASRDAHLVENQVQASDGSLLANPKNETRHEEFTIDHRVSFELTGEDVARCLQSKLLGPSINASDHSQEGHLRCRTDTERSMMDRRSNSEFLGPETACEAGEIQGEQHQKLRSFSLGSSKEFNFDNRKGEISDRTVRSEWWANEKVVGMADSPSNSWSFFPVLGSEVS